MKRFKSILLSFIFLLFLASSVVTQSGPVGGNGAEPVVSGGGGVSINDTIEFPVRLAEDVAANDPAFVTGYTYDGESVRIAPDCAKPETTFTPLFALVSHDGSRLFQVYKTTLGLPYAIWDEAGLGHTTLGSHTASNNNTAYAGYGGISSARDNSTVAIARYNSPYVLVYKWDSVAEQYVQLASPFATAPGQQQNNSIAVNHDGSKMVLRQNTTSPYFVSYTWDNDISKYVKDTESLDALNAEARGCTFIGNTNDIILGCVGYVNDGMVRYSWDSVNSIYVKTQVFPGLPSISSFDCISTSADGSRVVARQNSSSADYKTYFFQWDEGTTSYIQGNDLDIDGTTADAQVFISGNGQFVISSAGPNKVYVYKWSDVNQRFERVAVLPENTINSKPENISISDSGAQIVFPHYQTIYCYNYNIVGNGMQGYRLASKNEAAFPSAANFAGYFNKAGTAGSVVPFTAIWHKFVPTF